MKFIDAHAHIASWPELLDSEQFLIVGMDDHGVEAALVSNADSATFPSPENPFETPKTAAEGLIESLIFASVWPKRIFLAAWFCPSREPIPSPRFIELIENNRDVVKALKFHPFCERVAPDDPIMEPYYGLAYRLGLPILCHTAVDEHSTIGHLAIAAKAHPDLRFVAAHLELCSDHRHAIDVIADVPNIYADTAWVDMATASLAIDRLGPERIMFGTDAPIDGITTLDNPMYKEYFDNAAQLSPDLYRRLMRVNAIDFYDLGLKTKG